MYEVSVEGGFTARHAIPGRDGVMERPHEHRWAFTAVFRGRAIDAGSGVLIDFLAVREAMSAIESHLEGADLNAHPAFRIAPPSAERVAEWIAGELARRLSGELSAADPYTAVRLWRVEVTEAPGCRAAFLPSVDAGPGAP